MFWIGILIGMFLGVNIGIFILAICVGANEGDSRLKKVTYS
jgi:uncharacterized membrane-anchored protein YhcB (DUF1043 family)